MHPFKESARTLRAPHERSIFQNEAIEISRPDGGDDLFGHPRRDRGPVSLSLSGPLITRASDNLFAATGCWFFFSRAHTLRINYTDVFSTSSKCTYIREKIIAASVLYNWAGNTVFGLSREIQAAYIRYKDNGEKRRGKSARAENRDMRGSGKNRPALESE